MATNDRPATPKRADPSSSPNPRPGCDAARDLDRAREQRNQDEYDDRQDPGGAPPRERQNQDEYDDRQERAANEPGGQLAPDVKPRS